MQHMLHREETKYRVSVFLTPITAFPPAKAGAVMPMRKNDCVLVCTFWGKDNSEATGRQDEQRNRSIGCRSTRRNRPPNRSTRSMRGPGPTRQAKLTKCRRTYLHY